MSAMRSERRGVDVLKSCEERKLNISVADSDGRAVRFSLSKSQTALCLIALTFGFVGFCLVLLSSPLAFVTGVSSTNGAAYVRQKVALLSEQTARVQRYENELKERARNLDTVIGDALSLDPNLMLTPADRGKTRGQLGIGGVDEPRTRTFFSRRGSKVEAWDGIRDRIASLTTPRDKDFNPISLDSNISGYLEFRTEELRKLPIGVPVAEAAVSSGFGARVSPFNNHGVIHEGIDFSIDKQTPVFATADGIVEKAGYFETGYGIAVLIRHGRGYETLYGHLARTTVQPGAKVCRGEQIGYVGMTGNTTGPHLHYEIRLAGVPRNPAPYVSVASFLKLLSSSEEKV